MNEADEHEKEVHGLKYRCPKLDCDFVFPSSKWGNFDEHCKNEHALFEVGEPIPLSGKKGSKSAVIHHESKKRLLVPEVRKSKSKLRRLDDVQLIPLCSKQEVPCAWTRIDNFNPLGLSDKDFVKADQENKECISDWEQEPEDGFLELFEEFDTPVIQGVVDLGPAWRLIPVDVPRPTQSILRGLPQQQRCHDPRLA